MKKIDKEIVKVINSIDYMTYELRSLSGESYSETVFQIDTVSMLIRNYVKKYLNVPKGLR
jgi:hypothetical protein